jgi:membrane associated rhomboid family serine protease
MIPLKDDNPTSTFPVVTIAIISINILVFLYQLTISGKAEELFILSVGAIPYEITHFRDIYPPSIIPPPFTIFTAMFVHGGLLHLGGNMLYLWIFGDNIEDILGHIKFLVFYLSTGLIASLAHVYIEPSSNIPMIGASGAIAGILGAYLVRFPRARVFTLVFFIFFIDIVRIPAVFFLILWFVFQLISSGSGGGIAWFAHIGGFISGLLLIRCFESSRKGHRRYRR